MEDAKMSLICGYGVVFSKDQNKPMGVAANMLTYTNMLTNSNLRKMRSSWYHKTRKTWHVKQFFNISILVVKC